MKEQKGRKRKAKRKGWTEEGEEESRKRLNKGQKEIVGGQTLKDGE